MIAWLPGFTRVDLDLTGVESPEVGNAYDETGHPKICLHTTEGSTLEGAERAFARYPPHLGVDPKRRIRHQYLPLDRCSFSLRGSESDDEFVVQIEIVGFAERPPRGADLDWLGTHVVGPVARAIGCPLRGVPQGFHGPGEGITLASVSSPVRFKSEQALRNFSGVLGHQHAPPPDTHWDPGRIDIDRLLAAASGDDDMEPADIARGVELAVKSGGVARDDLKTLIIGSVLDGIRKPDQAFPDRGDLREEFIDLIREALQEGPLNPVPPRE